MFEIAAFCHIEKNLRFRNPELGNRAAQSGPNSPSTRSTPSPGAPTPSTSSGRGRGGRPGRPRGPSAGAVGRGRARRPRRTLRRGPRASAAPCSRTRRASPRGRPPRSTPPSPWAPRSGAATCSRRRSAPSSEHGARKPKRKRGRGGSRRRRRRTPYPQELTKHPLNSGYRVVPEPMQIKISPRTDIQEMCGEMYQCLIRVRLWRRLEERVDAGMGGKTLHRLCRRCCVGGGAQGRLAVSLT